MDILRAILGIIVFIGIAWLISSDRKAVNWRLVFTGIALQFVIALLVLKSPIVKDTFETIASGFTILLSYSDKGAEFVFGSWPDFFFVATPDASSETGFTFSQVGFVFAFKVLPSILFFSAFSAALYYLGILQLIVKGFAWVMSKLMGLSGAESLAAAANVFIGQTEAPLVIKPYLERMTKSEIMCLMTGGMATIAGGVFGAYVAILGGSSEEEQVRFASHLLSASIMSAPAAIVMAKILVPEKKGTVVDRSLNVPKADIGTNLLDAISNGTRDGLKLALNIGAMLLTFTAFMYMINGLLLLIGNIGGLNESIAEASRYDGLSLQYLLGKVFTPAAWLIGVDIKDLSLVGQVLGEKTILNEFFAYATLGNMKDAGEFASDKSIVIATYALCGFANFASIGIQIGGISALAPGQQTTLAKLGVQSLIGGTFACFLTAAIASMLI
ncbi:MAG: CNT family concentrative nucleoside transporter [Limisphaerales bacterium]|jgi:CNT family concentrative nucleoside transporter